MPLQHADPRPRPDAQTDEAELGEAALPRALSGDRYVCREPVQHPVLGQRVLVIGLRTDQGTPLEADPSSPPAGTARLGSVLLAIPDSDEQRYAAAIGADTFVLTLVTG